MRFSRSLRAGCEIYFKRLPALIAAAMMCFGPLPLAGAAGAQAQNGTVTLKELKAQAPERLRLTVATRDGETVTVDAPVILPQGDALPIVLCKRAAFDTAHIRDYYPLAKGLDRSAREASVYWDYAGSPLMAIFAESKKDILSGKTDYSKRSSLPMGELPPLNGYTVEQAMQFIYRNISLFQCDTALDLRPLQAIAMGGLCKVKSVRVTDPDSGATWREIAADPQKPIEGAEKGLWQIHLAQYVHGAQVFEGYYPYGMYKSPENPNPWDSPLHFYVKIMDEENCIINIAALSQKEVLLQDAPLLSYPALESLIRARIESGELKSAFQLTLGYSIKIVRGDACYLEGSGKWNMDARFALVPEWQILGFDEKDRENARHRDYAPPSEEEVLMPSIYGRYALTYELRLDAETGEPVLDYESMEYDLTKE